MTVFHLYIQSRRCEIILVIDGIWCCLYPPPAILTDWLGRLLGQWTRRYVSSRVTHSCSRQITYQDSHHTKMVNCPPLKYNRLDCSGNGFSFSSHYREPPCVIAAALGIPSPQSSNGISKPKTSSPPLRSWWEAQVRLYGLKCERWTLDGMKTVLIKAVKDDKLKVSEDLTRMEKVYNERYNIENEAYQKRAHEAKKF